ncbi:hypothetical protein [Streptosporangium sp. NPDC003464]
MDHGTGEVLDAVGPRLRALRRHRGITLTDPRDGDRRVGEPQVMVQGLDIEGAGQ